MQTTKKYCFKTCFYNYPSKTLFMQCLYMSRFIKNNQDKNPAPQVRSWVLCKRFCGNCLSRILHRPKKQFLIAWYMHKNFCVYIGESCLCFLDLITSPAKSIKNIKKAAIGILQWQLNLYRVLL